jgi:hypothetical protein
MRPVTAFRELAFFSSIELRNLFYIPITACFLLFTSCKMADAVLMNNRSSQTKKITVSYPADLYFIVSRDSLVAWDLSRTEHAFSTRDIYRYSLKLPTRVDTIAGILSFELKPKQEVTIFGSTSIHAMKRIVFMADGDTLQFKRMGNCWTFLITDPELRR